MSEIDRDKSHLFPPFAGLLLEFEKRLEAASLQFHLFEGSRSMERQAFLYAQGRSVAGAIVTNAKPGHSYHFFGMAADYVLDGQTERPGVQWSWDLRYSLQSGENAWKKMADIARGCGLEAAFYWKTFPEAPHVQCRYGLTIDRALELHAMGGMKAVWQEAQNWLEKQVWPSH
jgi:peptidoglycan LD-endopeptidase CwlK